MQATGTLHEARSSKGFILVVVAMICALLLGAGGGYLARSAGATGGVGHTVNAVRAPNGGLLDRGAERDASANQGSPQSDLTRALPTAAPAAHSVPEHGLIP